MVNYLIQWIRHHVTTMSERTFPNNPVELKVSVTIEVGLTQLFNLNNAVIILLFYKFKKMSLGKPLIRRHLKLCSSPYDSEKMEINFSNQNIIATTS